MLCEICGKNTASMHLTTIIDGEKKEQHICVSCAQKQGANFAQVFDIGQLLSGFMQESAAPTLTQQACSHCGMNYRQFKQEGLLGCAHCYDAFAPHLEPLLTRIHGHVRHGGKIPARAGASLHSRREIEKLSTELKQAIILEQFEKAAELRDKIRVLQSELEGGEGSEG